MRAAWWIGGCGLALCGSFSAGSIWITSISSAVFGNASGAQTGSYYESHDWPNWEITRSVEWPEAEAHSFLKTEADPSIPLPTMPGSYAFLKGFGSASARGDAEAYVSHFASFACTEAWSARLTTTGLGTITLEGPSGVITRITGNQSFGAELAPGEYRLWAGVSAINDGGSVFFLVPGPGGTSLMVAGLWYAVACKRRRGGA